MNFDFSEEQKQLREEVQKFLADKAYSSAVRSVLEGHAPFDRALWKQLGALGFLGAAIPEAYGGLGLGYLELCVIAEEVGRSLAPVPMSSSVYLAAEILKDAGSDAQKTAWLPHLASGEAAGTLALVETSGRDVLANIQATAAGGAINGVKIAVADGAAADFAIVLARSAASAQSLSLYLVDLNDAGVQRKTLKSIDPTRPHAAISFFGARAELIGREGDGPALIERAFDRAAILIAFEQVGGADRALEMARDYALERMAFGRQIGSFQAIKHMLADMYVSATLARSNAYYGAWALSQGAGELPVAAAIARVSATTAFQHCARNNIQVHGGMGFTWEFDCHLYYRRSNALALQLGPLSTWEDLLIRRMRDRGDLAIAA
jgi:alkylation response protein AidB-like acyl-CoA dehydrogenase